MKSRAKQKHVSEMEKARVGSSGLLSHVLCLLRRVTVIALLV